MDKAAVERYLARHVGPVTITDVHQTFPGYSRETWIVTEAHGDGYVLRVDPPGRAIVPVPLRVEYEVYRRLWGSSVPVAEPVWFDEGVEFAEGRAHMVRRLVAGSTKIPGLSQRGGAGPEIRRAVAYEVAEKLALVHTLDWHKYGLDEVLPAPEDPGVALADELAHWRARWADLRTDPFPLMTEALYWLEEQIPPGGDRLSLLKGNNGVGEEIWRDNRIVALSDWELAAIGDPALDWAFSQGLLALHDPLDTLAHYADVAGFVIDERRLAWSAVWIRVKASMTTNSGLWSYLDGKDDRPGLAAMGMRIIKTTELDLAEAIDGDVETFGRRLIASQRSPYID